MSEKRHVLRCRNIGCRRPLAMVKRKAMSRTGAPQGSLGRSHLAQTESFLPYCEKSIVVAANATQAGGRARAAARRIDGQ